MPRKQYIVIGAGLAGCLLSWRLAKAGQSVTLIGSSILPSASLAAAGVINPVTGRWMTKTWRIDHLLPAAERLYREIETILKIQAYHPMPLRRYCQHQADLKRIGRRMRNPRYANVLGDYIPKGEAPVPINDICGSFEIRGAAYVDLRLLIPAMRKHFREQNQYIDDTFTYNALQKTERGWSYYDIEASAIIFCEGIGVLENPWFRHLPFTPAKGETITIKSPTLQLPRSIYHHTKWILPYGEGHFRVGATYDSNNLSHAPTPAGIQQLEAELRRILSDGSSYTVAEHLAGIRPTTSDTRPFLGTHPEESGLHIFNGLGSKGASVAPEMSEHFINYLLNDEKLDPEVDIKRFSAPSTA